MKLPQIAKAIQRVFGQCSEIKFGPIKLLKGGVWMGKQVWILKIRDVAGMPVTG